MDTNHLRELFLSEFEDNIQKMDTNLVNLEKDPQNGGLLESLMRSSHTIKGSSAAMGYQRTAELTHALEDIFDHMRNNHIRINPSLMSTLFSALDALKLAYKSIKEKGIDIHSDTTHNLPELTLENHQKTESAIPAGDTKGKNIVSHSDNEMITHIKVPVGKLDNLMNLTEELLIDKMKLQNITETNDQLKPIVTHLSRVITDLQYLVMKTRLVTLEQIFSRFPRMVRDLASQMNKDIDLIITGSDMEIDRTVIEKLAEPLTHLLRNAIDHGIQKHGTIHLRAKRERQNIQISVEDNGSGVDWAKVLKVALERGIVDRDRYETYTPQLDHPNDISEDIVKILYDPKLSTKDEVTEVSGRGIGLNVVDIFTKQMGGRVIYKPVPTGGTCFTLELPSMVAVVQSLLVRVKDQIFAIPFSIIDHSIEISVSEIKHIADTEIIAVGGLDVPLIRLDSIFSLEDGKSNLLKNKNNTQSENNKKAQDTISDRMIVVLIRRHDEIAGIVVDELAREQDIVIKSLPPILHDIKGFSGTAFLGDGRTILVLDSNSLLENAVKL